MELGPEKVTIKTSEVEEKVESKIYQNCPKCGFRNSSDAIFCENCGKKFVQLRQLRDKVIQESIDHIYTACFLVIYPILGSLGFILNSPYVPNLVERLAMSFGMLLVPALVSALIIGTIINAFTKDMKSFKFKYNHALNHFEESVAGGFFSVFFSEILG